MQEHLASEGGEPGGPPVVVPLVLKSRSTKLSSHPEWVGQARSGLLKGSMSMPVL